MATDILNDEKI